MEHMITFEDSVEVVMVRGIIQTDSVLNMVCHIQVVEEVVVVLQVIHQVMVDQV